MRSAQNWTMCSVRPMGGEILSRAPNRAAHEPDHERGEGGDHPEANEELGYEACADREGDADDQQDDVEMNDAPDGGLDLLVRRDDREEDEGDEADHRARDGLREPEDGAEREDHPLREEERRGPGEREPSP